jgi:membrane protease subunit (stomatin/prohibitin family)
MVRLRAFGIYAFHLTDPKAFHTTLSGTLERFTSEQLEGQLRNSIVGHISDIFGESGVPFIDMASNQAEFGNALKAKMEPMLPATGWRSTASMCRTSRCPKNCRPCSTSASA